MIFVARLVLRRAIKDYIKALKCNDIETISECEDFFYSDQFDLITECAEMRDLKSDYVVRMCKKVV